MRTFYLALTVSIGISFTSCYNAQLISSTGQSGKPVPNHQYQHSFFWGLVSANEFNDSTACKCGVYRLVPKTNYLFALINVATLGLYSPVDVMWECAGCDEYKNVTSTLTHSSLSSQWWGNLNEQVLATAPNGLHFRSVGSNLNNSIWTILTLGWLAGFDVQWQAIPAQ